MSQKTIAPEQEFIYRTNSYTPQAPIAGFVNFLSKQYYSEQDEATVEVIRRAMGEFTNDAQLCMRMSVFSNKQEGVGRVLMNEQYLASTNIGVKMFSVSLVSGDDLHFPDFQPMAKASLHPVKKAAERQYVCLGSDMNHPHIQFASVYHQLQNLVCSLSDKLSFYVNYNSAREEYFLLGRPLDQVNYKYAEGEAKQDDRFQVLIRLHIPAVSKRELAQAA